MTMTIKGIMIPVIDKGDGSPVFFLHGAPDNKEEWNQVIDLLKDDYRCIAPDLPGFGASSAPPEDYDFSIEAQISFFETFVQQVVGDKKITLVLHDIGAVMGLAWAATHRDRVERILVMNIVLHTEYKWHTFARIMAAPILGNLFMTILNRKLFVNSFKRDSPLVREDQIQRMYEGLTPVARSSLLKLFRKMTKPHFFGPWETRLRDVTRQIPTRVIWGLQDPFIPVEYAHRIGDDVRMLEDCGHWVPLVKPDVVAEEVRGFHV